MAPGFQDDDDPWTDVRSLAPATRRWSWLSRQDAGTTPVGEGFASVNVRLRKEFNLYAAVRPVRNLTGVDARYSDVDLIIIRENTEGLYSGVENEITPGVVMSMKVATETGCERIARWAFRYATQRQRKK